VRHFRTPVTFWLPDTDGNAGVSGLATNDMPDKGEKAARPQNRTLNKVWGAAVLAAGPEGGLSAAAAAVAVAVTSKSHAADAAAAAASRRRRFSGNIRTTSEISRLLYLSLRHAMMPASGGWWTDVTLGGKGQILTPPHSSLVCAPQFSTTSTAGERVLERKLVTNNVLNHFS